MFYEGSDKGGVLGLPIRPCAAPAQVRPPAPSPPDFALSYEQLSIRKVPPVIVTVLPAVN
jgi:hypothetical protein